MEEAVNGDVLQFDDELSSSSASSSPLSSPHSPFHSTSSISFSETTTSFEVCSPPFLATTDDYSPSGSPTSSTVTLTTFSLAHSPLRASPLHRPSASFSTVSATAADGAGASPKDDEAAALADDQRRKQARQERFGDALTQKRSLISIPKPRTRSHDRLSGEFAPDKGLVGRLRGATFAADSRLLRERSGDPREVLSVPVSPMMSSGLSSSSGMSSSGDVTLIRHEEVYMEGWLTKTNAEQRRWFVLTANTFAYFRDENMLRVETRMHQEDIRKVTRSVMAGTETTRRPQNALMRMVKTPSRTRKKGSPFFGISQDSFATSPTRNTKSLQSPTTGSEKNLTLFPPNFYILTSCSQERAFALAGEDCVDVALWMLALGGLSQRNLSVPGDSSLEDYERRELLRYVHLEGYKGGILKTSREEEWHYWPKGIVKSDRGVDPPITYSWDGENFTPVLKEDERSYGRGKWNGVWMEWYAPKTSANVPAVLTYQWHPVAREYRTDRAEDNWKWTRHFLASTSGQGEWIMEGEIPEVVVMMLQMLAYARDRPDMLAQAQREEERREEIIIQNRLRDFEGSATDIEIERLLQLRKLSLEHRRRFMSRSDSEASTPSAHLPNHEPFTL